MRTLGRYVLYDEIAAGGMATVHLGRLRGAIGFSRTVAIKYLHPQFAKDPEVVAMFLDEARLAARIRHPNVVPTLDVVASQNEIFLVMEYVSGESLWRLLKLARAKSEHVPIGILGTIMSGVLHGLHAAYEAKSEHGEPLMIVHRDVSPQNIIVGIDGAARVLDFGVAKATSRSHSTRAGKLKGKLAYMAPEQLSGQTSHQTDLYAAAIVLWEAITNRRLFAGENEGETINNVMRAHVDRPSAVVAGLPKGLDEITLKGLARDPAERYATGREFALAIERCVGTASATEVGAWVESHASEALLHRAEQIAYVEQQSWDALSNDVTENEVTDHELSLVHRNSALDTDTAEARNRLWKRRTAIVVATLGTMLLSMLLLLGIVSRRKAMQASVRAGTDPEPTSSISHVMPSSNKAAPASSLSPLSMVAPDVSSSVPNENSSVQQLPITIVKRVQHAQSNQQRETATQLNAVQVNAAVQPSPVVATPNLNCDPAYSLNANGHKIWKRECM